jgi:hypothetical protein
VGLAVQQQPVPEHALPDGAELLGHALAGQVADGDDDLDALQAELCEAEAGSEPGRCGGYPDFRRSPRKRGKAMRKRGRFLG